MSATHRLIDFEISGIIDALEGSGLDATLLIQCEHSNPQNFTNECKAIIETAINKTLLAKKIKKNKNVNHIPESKVYNEFCYTTLKDWHESGMLNLDNVMRALQKKRLSEDKDDDFNQRVIADASIITSLLQNDKPSVKQKIEDLAAELGVQSTDADENPLYILRGVMQKRISEIEAMSDAKTSNDRGCLPSLLDELFYDYLPQVSQRDKAIVEYAKVYLAYYKAELPYFPAGAESLVATVKNIFRVVEQSINDEQMTECFEYVELLVRAKRAIEYVNNPIADDTNNIKRILEIAGPELEQQRKTSSSALIGGLALAFVGIFLVLKSYALLAVSAGTSSPVSMLGITLGNNMLTAGLAWAGITASTALSLYGLGLFVTETLQCTADNKMSRPPVRALAFTFCQTLASQNANNKAEDTIDVQVLAQHTVV